MTSRWPQVKNITSADVIRSFGIPCDDALDGSLTPSSFAILPMEGWDGGVDGSVTDLVRRRWSRFAASGASLVWGEATAVRPDGRANPRQLVLSESTVDGFAGLRASTWSGRFVPSDVNQPFIVYTNGMHMARHPGRTRSSSAPRRVSAPSAIGRGTADRRWRYFNARLLQTVAAARLSAPPAESSRRHARSRPPASCLLL